MPADRIHCAKCQTRLNVSGIDPGKRIRCPRCGHSMQVPEKDEPTRSLPSADRDQETRSAVHPGTQMIGPYEIVSKLGEGGMARVYKARHGKSRQLAAVKILRGSLSREPQAVETFYREARATAALNHPNLVKALEFGESDGYHFFAMEYIEGATLQKVIEKQGRIPEAGALRIAKQVAKVLNYAWAQGIVHRDIKPENLMVTPDLRVKLMDMGLAKAMEESHAAGEGGIFGTPMYASPEQLQGRHDLDVRSDIYSLGNTLYHAVTGELPYDAPTSALVMAKQIKEPLPDPRQKNPDLSLNFSMMLKKMTEKDPAKRYQTPEELLKAVANCRERLASRKARDKDEPEESLARRTWRVFRRS